MKKLPIVALIGQTNAGKSSLLNRLAHKNIAIVAREAGTTRDNVMAKIDDRFILIDTAGLKDPEDDFEASIKEQIDDAVNTADLILVTLDSTKYPDDRDKKIAKNALKSKKPVLLVLNKSDLKESLPDTEFLRLGIKPDQTFRTSATTGQGVQGLKHQILARLLQTRAKSEFSDEVFSGGAEAAAELERQRPVKTGALDASREGLAENSALTLALIGRPNVGKSSLFNSLAKKQQALVSSRQGTTRDVNRVNIKYKGQNLEILDTAGLRRPGKREVGIEKFSAIRTLAAIEEADVCALLIDATEPHSKLDQSLAGQIVDAGKGIIVVLTKCDLLDSFSAGGPQVTTEDERCDPATAGVANASRGKTVQQILDDLERDYDFIPYAPVLITSSETGQNVTKLFELAAEINNTRKQEVKTSELNKILQEAIISHPPAGLKNTHPKPKYIVQTDVAPPWFVVHGREMELMHWSYKRYLERKIREKYPFIGTPIKFSFRNEK
ncbi:50S ribosome-binding GTPase [Candidatus Saccharibacteria bacterium]|nr:50S ribosome-binding GTPase [Candidatus Saccharibacteria bacterium]